MIISENKARQLFKPGQLISINNPIEGKKIVDGYKIFDLETNINNKTAKRIEIEENTNALYITCDVIYDEYDSYSCELHRVLVGNEIFWFFDDFLKRKL
jgi:hypothetical protein